MSDAVFITDDHGVFTFICPNADMIGVFIDLTARHHIERELQELSGRLINQDAVKGKDTLGLVSMRERARLVHGEIEVTSSPGHGTHVDVRVPLFRSEQAI